MTTTPRYVYLISYATNNGAFGNMEYQTPQPITSAADTDAIAADYRRQRGLTICILYFALLRTDNAVVS